MSIRRIESSYAHCLDKEEISSSDMNVLLALAYCANELKDERCYPSDAYLSRLTHMSARQVRRARGNLRTLGLIDWNQRVLEGRQTSNFYRFAFPHQKLKGQFEGYEQVVDKKSTFTPQITPPPRTICPTPPDYMSYPPGLYVLPPRTICPTNTEYIVDYAKCAFALHTATSSARHSVIGWRSDGSTLQIARTKFL